MPAPRPAPRSYTHSLLGRTASKTCSSSLLWHITAGKHSTAAAVYCCTAATVAPVAVCSTPAKCVGATDTWTALPSLELAPAGYGTKAGLDFRPSSSNISRSALRSLFLVVSSLSPSKMLLAPAMKQSACKQLSPQLLAMDWQQLHDVPSLNWLIFPVGLSAQRTPLVGHCMYLPAGMSTSVTKYNIKQAGEQMHDSTCQLCSDSAACETQVSCYQTDSSHAGQHSKSPPNG